MDLAIPFGVRHALTDLGRGTEPCDSSSRPSDLFRDTFHRGLLAAWLAGSLVSRVVVLLAGEGSTCRDSPMTPQMNFFKWLGASAAVASLQRIRDEKLSSRGNCIGTMRSMPEKIIPRAGARASRLTFVATTYGPMTS